MSSLVAGLLQTLFPSKGEDGRLLCIGLDASGRTSWLYSLLLPGQHITTIPTIGFNVETVKHNGCSLCIWDVGGCDKIRPLWRHYFAGTQGLVFFVDGSDIERMDEVAEQLRWLTAAEELREAFVLVVSNKQDLPRALSPQQVSERLRLPEVLGQGGRMWTCLPGTLCDEKANKAQLDWITTVLRQHQQQQRERAAARAADEASKPAAAGATGGGEGGGGPSAGSAGAGAGAGAGGEGEGGGEPDVLERWLQVEDEPDEEFLRKLEKFSLDSWDHRTHLRIAWLYLTRLGRREGLRRIHASIRAFIQHSPLTRRRTGSGSTYHETMTYFWSHMVHFAIASQKTPEGATPDFRLFLLLNPQLSNGGLFLHYYTKKLMLLTPESRTTVMLPDKRPLPSIITDLSALSIKDQPSAPDTSTTTSITTTGAIPDAEFLRRFLDRSLDRWNHECLLRAMYCCLAAHGRRRGGEVALAGLRALQGMTGFHLTLNYCWLALLTHALAGEYTAALFGDGGASSSASMREGAGARLEEEGGEGAVGVRGGEGSGGGGVSAGARLPEWSELLASGTYASVMVRELVADQERYLRYYSKKVMFSGAAAVQFAPPDRRGLPSVV
ncbi:hypothetical protein Agub_g8525 [Astrephomene gubernaculifera]|uniref:ADP-ribosylation factor n=1 Tax=Astrephomene gubernaculifera TaxID=47775 RepID=A0AAD3DTK5_9CHLO|nr:hypothetical protein Agub_g8525 [Astrephomene gubernaculifera]